MSQSLRMEQKLLLKNEYWDQRLTPTLDNPFLLAPRDQIEKGLVTPKSYRRQDKAWGDFVSNKMRKQPLVGSINILGAGCFRDLLWIEQMKDQGCVINIADFSSVAFGNTKDMMQKHRISPIKVNFIQTSILEGWSNGDLSDEGVTTYFMSQFIEHQHPHVTEFMEHFGNFLRSEPGRSVYIVTPRLEDNDPKEVLWDHAKPMYDYEWQVALNKALGKEANFQVLGKHKYFNRTYCLYKITN